MICDEKDICFECLGEKTWCEGCKKEIRPNEREQDGFPEREQDPEISTEKQIPLI